MISARETTLCSRRITSMTAASSDLIELHRLFEFVRPVFRHRAYAFGCLDLSDRPVLYTVEGAIGVPVLDPQALRRQQVDVERRRSGLAAPCRLHSIADPPRWFLSVRIRRQRVSRVYRRKAGSPAQTSQPQPEAQPSRPAPGLQRVSVFVS